MKVDKLCNPSLKNTKIIMFLLVLTISISFVSAVNINNTLMAYWSNDNTSISGSTLYDDFASYDGTINGATSGAEGILGEALNFDGNDWVVMSNIINQDSFSISLWFKSTQSNKGQFVTQYTGGAEPFGEWIQFYLSEPTAGDISFAAGGGPSVNGSFNDGSWHHAVGIHSETTYLIYVDGELLANQSRGATPTPYTSTRPFRMGAYDSSGSSQNYNGLLDEVAIYSGNLTEEQVLALYNEGNACNPINNPTGCEEIVNNFTINTDMSNTINVNQDNLTINYNISNQTGSVGDIGNCTLFVNDVLNQTDTDINLTNNQNFIFEFEENITRDFNFKIECLVDGVNQTTPNYLYRVDRQDPGINANYDEFDGLIFEYDLNGIVNDSISLRVNFTNINLEEYNITLTRLDDFEIITDLYATNISSNVSYNETTWYAGSLLEGDYELVLWVWDSLGDGVMLNNHTQVFNFKVIELPTQPMILTTPITWIWQEDNLLNWSVSEFQSSDEKVIYELQYYNGMWKPAFNYTNISSTFVGEDYGWDDINSANDFQFRIRAFASENLSRYTNWNYSNIFIIENEVTQPNITYPLQNQTIDSNYINITWDKSSAGLDMIEYNVSYSTDNSTWNFLDTTLETNYNWNVTALLDGEYFVEVLAETEVDVSEPYYIRFEILRNLPPNKPNISSPANNTISGSNGIYLNFEGTDPDNDTLDYLLYLDINTEPITLIQNSSNDYYNYTGSDGTYYARIRTFDGEAYSEYSDTITFTKDTTVPTITQITPSDGQTVNEGGINFYYTVNTTANYSIDYCDLYIKGMKRDTKYNVTPNTIANLTTSLTPGDDYYWYVTCVDEYGLSGTSSSSNFFVRLVDPIGGTGGTDPTANTKEMPVIDTTKDDTVAPIVPVINNDKIQKEIIKARSAFLERINDIFDKLELAWNKVPVLQNVDLKQTLLATTIVVMVWQFVYKSPVKKKKR